MTRRGLAIATALTLMMAAACAEPSMSSPPPMARPGAQVAATPDGDTPPDHPTLVVCATILGTMSNAIIEGRATGDRQAIIDGYRAYGLKAAGAMGDVESRQAIGSSYAFYDTLTPVQLAEASRMCLAAVDRDFQEDDWW